MEMSLPGSVQKAALCRPLCTPTFMASAPAATPTRNTNPMVTRNAVLGFCMGRVVAVIVPMGLRLVRGQGGEHGVWILPGRLLRHDRCGVRRPSGVFGLVRDQIGPEDCQGHERGECHALAKRWVEPK